MPSLLVILAPTLVVLDMSNNDLSFLPESLRNCSSLEEINVSGNPLRQLPAWIGELTSLRMLAVDDCGLLNLPVEVSHLSSLHTICGEYGLKGRIASELTPQLAEIDWSHCHRGCAFLASSRLFASTTTLSLPSGFQLWPPSLPVRAVSSALPSLGDRHHSHPTVGVDRKLNRGAVSPPLPS